MIYYEVKSHGVTIELTPDFQAAEEAFSKSSASVLDKGIYQLFPTGIKRRIK